MGLSFTIAAGLRQRNHFRVRVTRDSWPYFTLSDSRLPQPGGAGPRTYIPQDQGSPILPLGTGFLFVASYDSQGYGGGIRTRLHKGLLLNQSSLHSYFYSLAHIHGKCSLLARIHRKYLLFACVRGTFVDSVDMESAFRTKSVSTNPNLNSNLC
jgi:hypothetical protein